MPFVSFGTLLNACKLTSKLRLHQSKYVLKDSHKMLAKNSLDLSHYMGINSATSLATKVGDPKSQNSRVAEWQKSPKSLKKLKLPQMLLQLPQMLEDGMAENQPKSLKRKWQKINLNPKRWNYKWYIPNTVI